MNEPNNQLLVFLVEDHPIMRDALRMIIHEVNREVKIVDVKNIEALQSTVSIYGQPFLVCLDLNLPDTNGINTLIDAQRIIPDSPIIVITSPDKIISREKCIRLGACDYIEKTDGVNAIFDTLQKVISPRASEIAMSKNPDFDLSWRERQLIWLLEAGLSNSEISQVLGLADSTVKVHLSRIFAKLRVNSRTKAIAILRDKDLI